MSYIVEGTVCTARVCAPRAYRLFEKRACNSQSNLADGEILIVTKNSSKRVGGRGFAHARPIAKCISVFYF